MDPWAMLNSLFGGEGNSPSGGSVTQGSPAVDQGIQPIFSWMIGQSFAGAGPLGHYFGLLYSSPGTGIPRVEWGGPAKPGADADPDYQPRGYESAQKPSNTGEDAEAPPTAVAPEAADDAAPRRLEQLDRNNSYAGSASARNVDEVRVLGAPRDARGSEFDWLLAYPTTGQENTIVIQPSPPPRRKQVVSPPSPPKDDIPTVTIRGQRPPRERLGVHHPDTAITIPEITIVGQRPDDSIDESARSRPDAFPPRELLTWPPTRPEYLFPFRDENAVPPRFELNSGLSEGPAPDDRNFWSRGGTGLAFGGLAIAGGLAALFWWNPVGWVAGASVALALAGGAAVTTASAVQLSNSYAGNTTAEQDAAMNRATSAALGVSSLGGLAGGVAGMMLFDDPAEGFEEGLLVGGLAEGVGGVATSLPRVVRTVPKLLAGAGPWAKALFLSPLWLFLGAGGGGRGVVRPVALALRQSGRLAGRGYTVEYLGTSMLTERDAAWARYQISVTHSTQEGVFRVTSPDGRQRIVFADKYLERSKLIMEAKYGDLGQMYKPEREAHIIEQARLYLVIADNTGGRVRYLVSTQRGATRLNQRFSWEFPDEMSSGQLWVDWVPWRNR